MMLISYLWIIIFEFHQEVLSSCIFPTQFQNSVWVDSDKGELLFDTVNMTGWDFQVTSGDMYEDWECFHISNEGTNLYLILLGKENITLFDETFTPYLCLELREISSVSYYYYLLWAEEEKYEFERISTTDSETVVVDPVQELCLSLNIPSEAVEYPETGEYHVLIKKGYEINAKQECHPSFFGEYWYKVTYIDSSDEHCGTGNEVWDVCSDYEHMSFDYSICKTEISYSGNGSVFCLVSMSSGSYNYQTVYNEDTTVAVSNGTYRFTCLVSSVNVDGSLNVSQTPGSCKKGQTPNVQPVFASNGSSAGSNLLLKPRRLCPKPTDDPVAKRNLSTGVIVGIVIAALILVIIIIVMVFGRLKMKCWQLRRKFEENENTKSPGSKQTPEDLVEKLPAIQEDNLNQSAVSTADLFQSVLLNQSPKNQQTCVECETKTDITDEANANIYTEIVKEIDENGTEDITEDITNIPEACLMKVDNDQVKCINEMATISHHNGKTDDIQVTRVTENANVIRKDLQHLNSTENIFSEYDAAMIYQTDHNGLSKSDLSINLKGMNDRVKQTEEKSLEFTRDDSDLNLKSVSKLKCEKQAKRRINKSEGNLTDAVKLETLKRKSSQISKLTCNSLEWNFIYTSPYALSEKEKQDILERKIKMQKRKKQKERRKREEKEKKERDNNIAFEKWKQQKRVEALAKSKSAETASVMSGKANRSKYWYPT